MATKKIEYKFNIGDKVDLIKNVNYFGRDLIRYDSYYIIKNIDKDCVELVSEKNEFRYFYDYVNIKNIKKVDE